MDSVHREKKELSVSTEKSLKSHNQKRSILESDFRKSKNGLWLLVGLVGAGKTTYSQRLWVTDPAGTIRSSLDEIIQMMSFYNYEPRMDKFYAGVEQSTIIDGLINGYKVIVDRTNVTKKGRRHFISFVEKIKSIAEEFFILADSIQEDALIELCEKNLIEKILIEESKKNVVIYSSFLKLVRDWKMRMREPELFPTKTSLIRKKLMELMKTESAACYFDVPATICIKRRTEDPLNVTRDRDQKIDWRAVIKKMKKQLEYPTKNEGFDRIYRIDKHGCAERK
jgi:hypothetical protein